MSEATVAPVPQTIALRLVTGLQNGRSIMEPAPDIPPGAVLIEAPLCASAHATTREQVSPFFHSGKWDVVHSLAIQFASLNHRHLTLNLSFESVAPEETHVLYVATVETLPPRPRESYLGAVAEVDVTYRFPYPHDGSDRRTVRFTLTDATAIEDLKHEINDLTDIAAGMSHGGLDRGESASLICRGRDGSETRVEVEHGRFVRVGETRALDDIRLRVLRVVARLAASTK